ncbi:MAG: hypothetical protein J6V72_11965 [Kiritimatiellae bacterium]|nr:hypothetical protein [Kiritimatiellia bacterium]
MKRKIMLGCLACAMGTVAHGVEVSCGTVSVTLDERAKGAVTRIASSQGCEFAPAGEGIDLFSVVLMQVGAPMMGNYVTSGWAKEFSCERIADGARLTYSGFEKEHKLEKAVCTVRADGDRLRWRITLTPKAGWAVQQTEYPRLLLGEMLGTCGADDAVVWGAAKGGVLRNPCATENGKGIVWGRQPGNLVAQFACWYDDSSLLYFACEDGVGEVKDLSAVREPCGMRWSWRRFGWNPSECELPYDVVLAAQHGTPAKPCAWQDAADLYKRWAVRQRWCGKPLRDRDDLPAWMKDAPAICRFYRSQIADPDSIRDWVYNRWLRSFPKCPLVMAYWGWEHRAEWASDYFPCVPSDKSFSALVTGLRAKDVHAFPWPSGYHWTLMYGEQPDGTFEYDDRERFARIAEPHAIHNRDGTRYDRLPGWLKGGHVACMCPGDDWTIDWWNRDVALELAKRGCELVQADQVVGGAYPECWATNHPHLPGNGAWKTERFRHQLKTMRETMRAAQPDAVVCFEEPEELFNDLVGIQDYRNCEFLGEWASVWNYLYHEYVPPFQSNPRRGDRFWQAHCCVDGQMPFLLPSVADGRPDGPALNNGTFERVSEDGRFFPGWENHAGKHHPDGEIKHGGMYSLRLEVAGTNRIQVSQNLPPAELDHTPGIRYRLSCWLRTEKKGPGTCVNCGVFGPGLKCYEWMPEIRFPEPGEGWKHVQSEFRMPQEKDADMLRIMINVGRGESKVWIDDMALEVVGKDGKVRPATVDAMGSAYYRFMRAWVDVYHGAGRDWLAHGRQIRPPRLDCARERYSMSATVGKAKADLVKPAVMHQAYESLDGRRAVVLANATDREQHCTLHFAKERMSLTLKPDEIRLVADVGQFW